MHNPNDASTVSKSRNAKAGTLASIVLAAATLLSPNTAAQVQPVGIHSPITTAQMHPVKFNRPPKATQVWDINSQTKDDKGNVIPDCFGQDFGSIVHYPGWDRWLLFYGAVSDLGPYGSCPAEKKGYSEDIWLTWSATDGVAFGQELGARPPLLVLNSMDYAKFLNEHECDASPCVSTDNSGWLIGDPAVGIGKSGTWYMFFDTQLPACDGRSDPIPENGIYAASTKTWNAFPWNINGRPKTPYGSDLPGNPRFNFPTVFSDPLTEQLILYYNDRNLEIHAGEIVDDGIGTTIRPLSDAPVLPGATADRISVYEKNGKYYAVADNFGQGKPESLDSLWLLGPSDVPYSFDWSSRQQLLKTVPDTFYSFNLWAPSVISPEYTGDGTTRVYFWGNGLPGCGPYKVHMSAGVIILPKEFELPRPILLPPPPEPRY